MWGLDEEQLTNLSNYEVHGENYCGNHWEDRMKLLAVEQQQLAMLAFGQIRALERSSESTELTFGQMLAMDKEFSNETFGQTLAFERNRESSELTFGQLLATERNLELQKGQLTFGQIRAIDKELSNKTFGQIRAESSELTFGQLLANERKLELQKKHVEQVANDRAAEEIQMDFVLNSMEIEQCMADPLKNEFELYPLGHVETQDDSSISHAGADEMLGFQTTHTGADEVCEWVILNSKEVVKEEVTTVAKSIETPHPELKLCQILDLEARHGFQDHQLPPPRPTHKMMVKKKFHDYGMVVLNSSFQSVTGILLQRRKDPGSVVIPRVKTH